MMIYSVITNVYINAKSLLIFSTPSPFDASLRSYLTSHLFAFHSYSAASKILSESAHGYPA